MLLVHYSLKKKSPLKSGCIEKEGREEASKKTEEDVFPRLGSGQNTRAFVLLPGGVGKTSERNGCDLSKEVSPRSRGSQVQQSFLCPRPRLEVEVVGPQGTRQTGTIRKLTVNLMDQDQRLLLQLEALLDLLDSYTSLGKVRN